MGDVRDKVAILIDDMCDTGGTIKLATRALLDKGVKEVYAVVSHGAVFSHSTQHTLQGKALTEPPSHRSSLG